ncbi:hypothetical protein HPP92_012018 [Vanilla planifolia]|uniref:Uncharacterized protein n=1 Tax=Vanilla planifolia TaxID=51239 RepID=A0A835QWT0_VANPL|nr:hypothetical protein HPP92_012018 [Vanilla planifolia]
MVVMLAWSSGSQSFGPGLVRGVGPWSWSPGGLKLVGRAGRDSGAVGAHRSNPVRFARLRRADVAGGGSRQRRREPGKVFSFAFGSESV